MKRVLLGMSGGVDSSVSAYLLKEQGYEVVGLTFSITHKEDDTSINDAKLVCSNLGIEHHVIDYKDFFKDTIIKNFIESYQNCETPNPCVLCNKKIKFGLLWDKAKELNCDYLATGHYASIKDNKIYLTDSPKDQSYFLYSINKEVLPHIIFPLSEYTTKDEIRNIAITNNLVTAKKKDSQDICFIENGDYTSFLEHNLKDKPKPGNFILNGEVIGTHKGLIYYTIGQRKGLGISYKTPLYVISLNKDTNEVILGNEEDLYKTEVSATNINLLVDNLPNECLGKVRYRSKLTPCKITYIDSNNIKVTFSEPVKSVTPGQSLVLYDNNNILLGGGIITSK